MNVTATSQNAAPAAAPEGKAAPAGVPGGKDLPPAGRKAPHASRASAPVSIEKALQQIQTYLSESRRQLSFLVDERSGRTVIRVVNPVSGELIRQIPSEEVLEMAARLDSQVMRLLDTEA